MANSLMYNYNYKYEFSDVIKYKSDTDKESSNISVKKDVFNAIIFNHHEDSLNYELKCLDCSSIEIPLAELYSLTIDKLENFLSFYSTVYGPIFTKISKTILLYKKESFITNEDELKKYLKDLESMLAFMIYILWANQIENLLIYNKGILHLYFNINNLLDSNNSFIFSIKYEEHIKRADLNIQKSFEVDLLSEGFRLVSYNSGYIQNEIVKVNNFQISEDDAPKDLIIEDLVITNNFFNFFNSLKFSNIYSKYLKKSNLMDSSLISETEEGQSMLSFLMSSRTKPLIKTKLITNSEANINNLNNTLICKKSVTVLDENLFLLGLYSILGVNADKKYINNRQELIILENILLADDSIIDLGEKLSIDRLKIFYNLNFLNIKNISLDLMKSHNLLKEIDPKNYLKLTIDPFFKKELSNKFRYLFNIELKDSLRFFINKNYESDDYIIFLNLLKKGDTTNIRKFLKDKNITIKDLGPDFLKFWKVLSCKQDIVKYLDKYIVEVTKRLMSLNSSFQIRNSFRDLLSLIDASYTSYIEFSNSGKYKKLFLNNAEVVNLVIDIIRINSLVKVFNSNKKWDKQLENDLFNLFESYDSIKTKKSANPFIVTYVDLFKDIMASNPFFESELFYNIGILLAFGKDNDLAYILGKNITTDILIRFITSFCINENLFIENNDDIFIKDKSLQGYLLKIIICNIILLHYYSAIDFNFFDYSVLSNLDLMKDICDNIFYNIISETINNIEEDSFKFTILVQGALLLYLLDNKYFKNCGIIQIIKKYPEVEKNLKNYKILCNYFN